MRLVTRGIFVTKFAPYSFSTYSASTLFGTLGATPVSLLRTPQTSARISSHENAHLAPITTRSSVSPRAMLACLSSRKSVHHAIPHALLPTPHLPHIARQ